MTRTFIDSGVLIAAARGSSAVSKTALAILTDSERQFASSILVILETIPKSTFLKREPERSFYERFFNGVKVWASFDAELAQAALSTACEAGMSAVDALHIAAQTQCEEFVTTEKITKPIHRTRLLTVTSIP